MFLITLPSYFISPINIPFIYFSLTSSLSCRSRLQWISALRQAVSVTAGAEGFQRRARAGRRGAGARREKEVRDTKARLQHEVRARLAAEAQAQVSQHL